RLDIGISGRWQKFETAAQFLVAAESALDDAKRSAGEKLALYDPASARAVIRAQTIERNLWNALDHGEISILYQPLVDLASQRIVSAEALIRWNNRELGFVGPDEFIPIAEQSGTIEMLGRHVLRQACASAATWPEDLAVSVNVSAEQIARGNLVKDVEDALSFSGIAARRLTLELTETAVMPHDPLSLEQISELRKRGIEVAIDDFGTGFAGYEQLALLPIDTIKIDRVFVTDIIKDEKSRAIVHSIATLAKGLDLKVVAEGIEEEGQIALLRLAGCSKGQGYYFGKPMNATDLLGLVEKAA
ncbi:MAG: EAL domain-containing protein, partial [Rhizobiales bacterium]|nr:EAL domain-containing protein [Hyphomicrobiales bacterium]